MAARLKANRRTSGTPRILRSSWAARVAVALGAVVLVAGCTGFRLERQGKDMGQAICDLKSASNKDEADKAVQKFQKASDKAQRITGRAVNQDVRQINEQISDLQKHVPNGNSARAQQDISALQRNVNQAVNTSSGHAQRFYEGVSEGLTDCESGG